MSTQSKLIATKAKLKKIGLIIAVILFGTLLYRPILDILFSDDDGPQIINEFDPYFPADNKFGELSLPNIGPLITIAENSNPFFSISGNFPVFPTRNYIYEINSPTETFLTVSNAEENSKVLGFENKSQSLGSNILLWQDTQGKNLEFVKTNLELNLTSNINFKNSLEKNSDESIVYDNNPLEKISSELNKLNINYDNYILNKPETYKIESKNNQYGFTISEDSNFLLYNYRQSLQSVPLLSGISLTEELTEIELENKIYKAFPFLTNFYISFHLSSPLIEDFTRLKYLPIEIKEEEAERGVYSLVSIESAFEKLQKGEGFLRSLEKDENEIFDNTKDSQQLQIIEFNVEAENTELAYYINETNTGYTYPIFIFRGNAIFLDDSSKEKQAKFIFYVDALQ